jgi:hypothetical protein
MHTAGRGLANHAGLAAGCRAGARGPAAQAFTRPTGELSVALLQSNVSQDEKFAVDHMPQTLAWVGRELVAAKADLVLTPETAVPLLPDQLEPLRPATGHADPAHFAVPRRAALVGRPLGDFDARLYQFGVGPVGGQAPAWLPLPTNGTSCPLASSSPPAFAGSPR